MRLSRWAYPPISSPIHQRFLCVLERGGREAEVGGGGEMSVCVRVGVGGRARVRGKEEEMAIHRSIRSWKRRGREGEREKEREREREREGIQPDNRVSPFCFPIQPPKQEDKTPAAAPAVATDSGGDADGGDDDSDDDDKSGFWKHMIGGSSVIDDGQPHKPSVSLCA